MATTKQITAKYIEFIAKEVINQFGGSYQTYETHGKVWRQQMKYSKIVGDFVMRRTVLFLDLQDIRDLGNLNMMHKVCYNIAEHLSKYFVKQSPELTRKVVTTNLLNQLFFNSGRFVAKFQKIYKRPIDLTNEVFVKSNPGVVAMYKAIQAQQQH